MQLREILDLDAMLSKGPSAEQVEGAEDDTDEISEKTAGTSFKEEEDVKEEAAVEEDEDDLTERRAPRPSDDDDEDNTLSLAQMEEQLKPLALERFGYDVSDPFKATIAFQRRFRPDLIDGIIDGECRAKLLALLLPRPQ